MSEQLLTMLGLAEAAGAQYDADGTMPGSEFVRLGLPMLGGCEVCGAGIAAYNAYPTRTGYLRCSDCVGHDAFATAAADAEWVAQWVYRWDQEAIDADPVLVVLLLQPPAHQGAVVPLAQVATMAEARALAAAADSYWFSDGTTRFFGSHYREPIYGGAVWVQGDRDYSGDHTEWKLCLQDGAGHVYYWPGDPGQPGPSLVLPTEAAAAQVAGA